MVIKIEWLSVVALSSLKASAFSIKERYGLRSKKLYKLIPPLIDTPTNQPHLKLNLK